MNFAAGTHPPSPVLRRLLEVLAAADAGGNVADIAHADLREPPAGTYRAVIGAVPASGTVAAADVAANVRALARSRRAELVAIAWAIASLEPDGRLALIVPESLLDGTTQAHELLRRRLVEEHVLEAVLSLRAGLYRPRARAAILVVGRGGQTRRVAYCELNTEQDLRALAERWPDAAGTVRFSVPREDIAPPAYALDMARYRGSHGSAAAQPSPHELLHEIAELESEILQGIRDLVGMLR